MIGLSTNHLSSYVVAGLVFAFIMGALAHRIRISPLVGYLLAGVLIGPFTPGFVADSNLANELAELGVILLMFGVGLHFSLRDLMAVKNIAVPGAVVQIAAATLLGVVLAWAMGWSTATGLVFGLSLSVASTVVLLRALQGQKLLETEQGRIAVGWLIVEDLVMVIAIVLLPVLAEIGQGGDVSGAAIAYTLGEAGLKVVGFVLVMLVGDGVDAPRRHLCAIVEVLHTTRRRRPWQRLARSGWILRRLFFMRTARMRAGRWCSAGG